MSQLRPEGHDPSSGPASGGPDGIEGRWGRRVYGYVRDYDKNPFAEDCERGFTLFCLEFYHELGGDVSFIKFLALNEDLEERPWMYSHILDKMVRDLEKYVQEIQALE